MQLINNEQQHNEQQHNKLWISTSGYRLLMVFQAILLAPKTLNELIEFVKSRPLLNNVVSKDTIRFDINTLRLAGCEITKPSKTNNYTYKVISHPFKLKLSLEELKVLIDMRNKLSESISLQDIYSLNYLYDKILSLTFDNFQMEFVRNSCVICTIDKNILITLSKSFEKKVQIDYNSPYVGIETINIIPLKIIYENQKVYLSAYNFKYNSNSYFDVSHITKINSISIENVKVPDKTFQVLYEVNINNMNKFELTSYETIFKEEPNSLIINANVNNEFMFTQRLLLLGRNFKIISPDYYRQRLLDKIKQIQQLYKEKMKLY